MHVWHCAYWWKEKENNFTLAVINVSQAMYISTDIATTAVIFCISSNMTCHFWPHLWWLAKCHLYCKMNVAWESIEIMFSANRFARDWQYFFLNLPTDLFLVLVEFLLAILLLNPNWKNIYIDNIGIMHLTEQSPPPKRAYASSMVSKKFTHASEVTMMVSWNSLNLRTNSDLLKIFKWLLDGNFQEHIFY